MRRRGPGSFFRGLRPYTWSTPGKYQRGPEKRKEIRVGYEALKVEI
jgi:hypothetical protein